MAFILSFKESSMQKTNKNNILWMDAVQWHNWVFLRRLGAKDESLTIGVYFDIYLMPSHIFGIQL